MGLFGLFKKSNALTQTTAILADSPYKDSAANLVYNLLFCDDLELYKANTQPPYSYPFDILFPDISTAADLQKIIDDAAMDTRVRVLAYNKERASGRNPERKELLAVIVEVGLDGGLDVLASFKNGSARYINQTGKILIWETMTDTKANELTKDLFVKSQQVVNQIGPWDNPRRPHPAKGSTRITFLVSDGLYFGEAPTNVLFNDPLAGPALKSATGLMQYLTEKSLKKEK
ncbi:MAG TPA: hypothetical protein VGM30_22595 [Puia sp.]|jgi:hypothetical protein